VSVSWLQWEIVFGYSVSKKDSYLVSCICLTHALLLHIPLLALTDGQKDGHRPNQPWLGWVTYGPSRLILVGLGNLRFLQVNPGWAG
jgi:hypothetical protein